MWLLGVSAKKWSIHPHSPPNSDGERGPGIMHRPHRHIRHESGRFECRADNHRSGTVWATVQAVQSAVYRVSSISKLETSRTPRRTVLAVLRNQSVARWNIQLHSNVSWEFATLHLSGLVYYVTVIGFTLQNTFTLCSIISIRVICHIMLNKGTQVLCKY